MANGSGADAGFSYNFFSFHLLIIMFHAYLSSPIEMSDYLDKFSHYHTLGHSAGNFASKPALGWLQTKKVQKLYACNLPS
jgi:hypothetical protein